MRINSCRKCGTELEINKKCNVCREIVQFSCHTCDHITDEQIHSVCCLVDADSNLLKTIVA